MSENTSPPQVYYQGIRHFIKFTFILPSGLVMSENAFPPQGYYQGIRPFIKFTYISALILTAIRSQAALVYDLTLLGAQYNNADPCNPI